LHLSLRPGFNSPYPRKLCFVPGFNLSSLQAATYKYVLFPFPPAPSVSGFRMLLQVLAREWSQRQAIFVRGDVMPEVLLGGWCYSMRLARKLKSLYVTRLLQRVGDWDCMLLPFQFPFH